MKSLDMADADDDESVSMGELFDTQCNAIDIELIELVKDRPALYDIRIPQKDRTKIAKEAIWNEVSEAMQRKLKPLAAEIRWKYLRENYIKARKKQKLKDELVKKNGASVKNNKCNRKYAYRYYEHMMFLNDALDHQKMVTLKNTAKLKTIARRSKRMRPIRVQQASLQETKAESRISNDVEESIIEDTDALYDHQYETVAIAIENAEPVESFSTSTIEIDSSLLNSTAESQNIHHESNISFNSSNSNSHLKSNVRNVSYEQYIISPIDGFLARLGEGLKRLPYRERSKLELEFLSRLNQVEDELGLLD